MPEFSRDFHGGQHEVFTSGAYKGNRGITPRMKHGDKPEGYFGNPQASIGEALAEDPDFAAALALRADLAGMSSEQASHTE